MPRRPTRGLAAVSVVTTLAATTVSCALSAVPETPESNPPPFSKYDENFKNPIDLKPLQQNPCSVFPITDMLKVLHESGQARTESQAGPFFPYCRYLTSNRRDQLEEARLTVRFIDHLPIATSYKGSGNVTFIGTPPGYPAFVTCLDPSQTACDMEVGITPNAEMKIELNLDHELRNLAPVEVERVGDAVISRLRR